AAGRLDSVVTYGGGLTEEQGVRVGYDGVRVSELSGYLEDPSSGLRDDVLRVARSYDGYMETARTIERFVDVSSVPGAGSFEPWRVDATVLDGFGRPEAKVWQLSSAASVPSIIERQDLYWGRDSKLVGSVKSWSLGGVEDLGQVRIAAYDGKSRLQGLRTAEAGTQAEITAWRSWLDNRANIETLQDPTVDAQAATAGLGRWRSFERNSLGSLETERLDGITDWSGT